MYFKIIFNYDKIYLMLTFEMYTIIPLHVISTVMYMNASNLVI